MIGNEAWHFGAPRSEIANTAVDRPSASLTRTLMRTLPGCQLPEFVSSPERVGIGASAEAWSYFVAPRGLASRTVLHRR